MSTPRPVRRALDDIGASLRQWRLLLGLSQEQTADRADISVSTLKRLESGEGAALEAFLRVARALGRLDEIVQSVDPMTSDVGRLRADELIPRRAARGHR